MGIDVAVSREAITEAEGGDSGIDRIEETIN